MAGPSMDRKVTIEIVIDISAPMCYHIENDYYNSQRRRSMVQKLFDSERKVMEVLWREGDLTAGQLAKILREKHSWNRNTTYTVIKKLVEKGAIQRREPNYICHSILSREQVQREETDRLIDELFDGSRAWFLSAYISGGALSQEEIQRLKALVDSLS